MSDNRAASKKDAFIEALARGRVQVQFDPHHRDVTIPEHLRGEPVVVFDYGLALAVAITDMLVTDDGISATLSFSRRPHYTFVPWGAVFAIVDARFRIALWLDDAPKAWLEEREKPAPHPARGALHLVKGGKA